MSGSARDYRNATDAPVGATRITGMGIASSGPRRHPSPQLLTGSMAPSPARVRVSGAHAGVAEVAEEVAAHRAMNIFIAAVALFVALPLLLLIAIAINLT